MGDRVGKARKIPVVQLNILVPDFKCRSLPRLALLGDVRAMEAAPIMFPYSSLIGDTDIDAGKAVPSLRCLIVS